MNLSELNSVEEVDAFIDQQICRDLPMLRADFEAGKYTPADCQESPKLDALRKALERRAELLREVATSVHA